MSNYEAWDKRRGKIVSKKGGWRIGTRVESHGYDLINDLVGHYSYMQIVILNAIGRMPSKAFADWVESVYICFSWPDPRIWCNRIGALGGTVNASTASVLSSGIMAADSKVYGTRPLLESVAFIQNALQDITQRGISVEEFVDEEVKKRGGKPYILGFARPIAKGDERIAAMERVAKNLGFEVGPHLSLAYEIENVLSQRFDETMNMGGYGSAFLADQGLTPVEAYRIHSMMITSGVMACHVDNADTTMGLFSPLRIDDIEYQGSGARSC